MVEKNMVTLTERTIMKSRSGVYSDTAENRRKHRVGQKYGAEKQSDDGEKTEKKETDPAKELEAVNKVIVAINEGKLNLPAAEVMKLSEKKQKLEAAKNQAEKINAGVKANEEKKNAEEAKETSKKINEAQKKEAEKKEESSSKKYAEMDIKEAKKELLGKEITFKKYFFDGVDSYKDAVGKISQVRLYGKEKQPVLAADFPNGDSIQISLKQLDERKASNYEIGFDEKAGEVESDKKGTSQESSDTDKEDLREARRKLSYLQDNEERLIKRDGKEKYDERLKQAKDEVEKLKGDTPKEEPKSEPKQSEAEESYTRIKFDDVPNSGKINLKKYLSEKVRKGVDEKWSNIKNIPTENLKKMEKGLVNDLNKNFEAIKKSQRAELLYSIMKVKGELESRGKENKGEQSSPKLYSGGKISGTKNEYSKNLNDVLNSENADSIVIPEHKLQGWHDTEDALAGTNWKVSREVDKNGNYELGGKYYIFHKRNKDIML
jgi:hypothetical protein|nr:MAG TPA: hypothetical protein [Caudoviricetes sp.]